MSGLLGKTIAFRADASLHIGAGHVMRCLTLADGLKARGSACHFFCRPHPGNLIGLIRNRGHVVHSLPDADASRTFLGNGGKAHDYASWLGAAQDVDASDTLNILEAIQPDWLVVDHYALDRKWEQTQRGIARKILVIDDLANRSHDCEILLDQNLGRDGSDYSTLVPAHCTKLVGPGYALLRPEFAELRDYSLNRRKSHKLKSLLITMGGMDQPNATGKVLKSLRACNLPHEMTITVVMGEQAPWLQDIREMAAGMPWRTDVLVNVMNMAQIMANVDFAFGAAGSTSWERCCLGLPGIIVVLADNQREIAEALHQAGAAYNLGSPFSGGFPEKACSSVSDLCQSTDIVADMSAKAATITDGSGVCRVMHHMEQLEGK